MVAMVSAGALGAVACGPVSQAGGTSAPSPHRDRNAISTEELQSVSHDLTNLYDVVQRLHPEWLREQVGSSTAPSDLRALGGTAIQVYVDNTRAGGVDILKQLTTTSAGSLRFYSQSDAQMRYGSAVNSSVIEVNSPGASGR
jgi:hypothetical protein